MGNQSVWAFDAGNTSLKIALFEDGKISWNQSFPWSLLDVDGSDFQDLRSRFPKAESPNSSAIACVGRPGQTSLVKAVMMLVSAEIHHFFANSSEQLPFEISYPIGKPGADRLANLAALRRFSPDIAAMSLDFGTATHSEVKDADGNFAGGIIAPGISLQARSLADGTQGVLPQVGFQDSIHFHPNGIANSTQGAITTGILLGQAALADRLIREAKNHFHLEEMPIFLTGGHAYLVAPLMNETVQIEPRLTLLGLYELHQFYQSTLENS